MSCLYGGARCVCAFAYRRTRRLTGIMRSMPLLRDVERVWLRVKDSAAVVAERHEPLSHDRAWAIVETIVQEELAFLTPLEAREYLTQELRRMAAPTA